MTSPDAQAPLSSDRAADPAFAPAPAAPAPVASAAGAPAPVEPAPVASAPVAPAPAPAAEAEQRVIDTGSDKADGLVKCARCGSSEISYSFQTFSLLCAFCRHAWNEPLADERFGFGGDASQITGVVIGSGSQDITIDAKIITIKCQGCGAEIVIDPRDSMNARCHWCRQVLSVNEQVPNGLVPDAVLPFSVTHEQAVGLIRKFAGSRRLFAEKRFKSEFVPENIVGVYMPYMSIDANLFTQLRGEGEIETRRYTVTVGEGDDERKETRFDADVYDVDVTYDFTIDDLITESSSTRADMTTSKNTNNVINALLPFDIQNAVAYSSHYLTNFTSESRDLDIDAMMPLVEERCLSIARANAAPGIQRYGRGVRWAQEGIKVKGVRWQAVYLPVWLYSHREDDGTPEGMVHYIVVNGRNGKTMGSVPVSRPKLLGFAGALGVLTTVGGFIVEAM